MKFKISYRIDDENCSQTSFRGCPVFFRVGLFQSSISLCVRFARVLPGMHTNDCRKTTEPSSRDIRALPEWINFLLQQLPTGKSLPLEM